MVGGTERSPNRLVVFEEQGIIKMAESDSDASTIPAKEEACVANF